MQLWKVILLFMGAFTGGMSVFLFRAIIIKMLKLILSFSGAFLFGITVLHLIPDAYHGNDNYVGVFYPHRLFVPDRTGAIFGGHRTWPHTQTQPRAYCVPTGYPGQFVYHAFLEGMPLAEGNQNQLVYGIALHHVPAAFALATVLLANKQTKGKTIFFVVLFAIMAPAGYFFSDELSAGELATCKIL